MNYWKEREIALLKKENAWLNDLSPFMKMIDSHIGYIVLCWFSMSMSFIIGLVIGFLL